MKKHSLLFVILLPLLALGAGMEKIHIIRIADANLFIAEDGRFLRMAGIDAPSVASADSFFARKAIRYMRHLFAGRAVYFLAESHAGDTLDVHLFQKYPLSTVNLNARFIGDGYGRYKPNKHRRNDAVYVRAQERACKDGKGLWNKENLKPVVQKPAINIFLAAYAPNFRSSSNSEHSSLLRMEWQHFHSGNLFQAQLFATNRVYSGEEGYTEKNLIAAVSYAYLGDYFGIKGGVLLSNLIHGEGPPRIAAMTFSLQAGLMRRQYLIFLCKVTDLLVLIIGLIIPLGTYPWNDRLRVRIPLIIFGFRYRFIKCCY